MINDNTSMFAIVARRTSDAATESDSRPLSCLCTVTHGADTCVVLAPDRAAVDRVMRDRRVRLGLSGAPRVTVHAMVAR